MDARVFAVWAIARSTSTDSGVSDTKAMSMNLSIWENDWLPATTAAVAIGLNHPRSRMKQYQDTYQSNGFLTVVMTGIPSRFPESLSRRRENGLRTGSVRHIGRAPP